jgi:two-component system invasion response regulator UvrY
LLRNLTEATTHKVTSVEDLLDKKTIIDLIFFDAELGEQNILQQAQLYHQKNKQIKWVVVNLFDVCQSIKYIQAGAAGILTTLSDTEKLQQSIQSIIKDPLYLEEDLIQILAFRQIKKSLLPFSELTAREFDVFCLLAENYSIQAIADILSVTTKTAFNCQTQLRKKLEIKNKQQLIDLANKYKLVF